MSGTLTSQNSYAAACVTQLTSTEIPAPPPTKAELPTFIVILMLVIAVVYLRWQGRIWWCKCGQFYPISLNTWSEHNSQHLFDAYSLSHILHGVIFFGLLWLLRKWIAPAWRFVIAIGVEVTWEMCENSPFIINRYREATASLGYSGDSIANSLGDITSLAIGYWIASKLGLWKSAVLLVSIELLMLWWIRDNLTLNVLMLLWPIDAIRKWQSGAA